MAAGGESTANFGELSKYFIGEMEGVRRFATADRVEADSEPLPHSDRLGDGGSQAGGDRHASAHGSASGIRVLHRLQSILGCVRLLLSFSTSFSGLNDLFLLLRLMMKSLLQDDKVRVVQTLLFVTGINTLLQTLFGTRLPTIVGGSYAFVVPIISIIHDSSLTRITDDHEVSRQVIWSNIALSFSCRKICSQNSSVDWFDCVAEVSPNHESDTRSFNRVFLHSDCSRLQPVVGYLLQVHLLLFDHKMYLCLLSHELIISFCFRFFSPLGMVPVVSLVGFGLFDRGFPVVLLLLLLFFLDIISKICYMKR
ncbi:hypothetical protein BHE74_00040132 [Ensete ventricosum]|nr:hypothetical protein BHE74_00040132 [Ensete ventricosum]